jgi:hypothetical protein
MDPDSMEPNINADPDPEHLIHVCMRKLTALGSGSGTLVLRSVRGTLGSGSKTLVLGLKEEP